MSEIKIVDQDSIKSDINVKMQVAKACLLDSQNAYEQDKIALELQDSAGNKRIVDLSMDDINTILQVLELSHYDYAIPEDIQEYYEG